MTYSELKVKISDLTELLFAHPQRQDYRATELWVKFRNEGFYIILNLERPIPDSFKKIKLVGDYGNTLDCNENKRDELLAYNERLEVLEILNNSLNFRGNISDTVEAAKQLFDNFQDRFLHLSK